MKLISLTWKLPGLTSTLHLLSAAKAEMPTSSGWVTLTGHLTDGVLGQILTGKTSESDCAGGDVFKRVNE